MNSEMIILIAGMIFFYLNVHWNNKLFEKKQQLEDLERELNKQMKGDKE